MSPFVIGLIVGLFIGTMFGIFIIAILIAGKRSEE